MNDEIDITKLLSLKKWVVIQFIFLLAGMIFAWTNFGLELASWLNKTECTVGCNVSVTINPFMTPCFYGAVFFTLNFIISAISLKKSSN
jgi:hypothetical protein